MNCSHFRWLRWIIGGAVVCGLILAPEVGSRYFLSRSILMRLSPVPRMERIEFSGSAANGLVLDGHGGYFNEGKLTQILIRSEKHGDVWDRPSDITIRNLRLRGSIRIAGMGRNGESEEVRLSSYREGHTERTQSAAPTRILISNVEIEAVRRIPVYLGPGVTGVTIENCKLTGKSNSVAVYLDAESRDNHLRDNIFAVYAAREVIAIDGSADNQIEGNRFDLLPLGGIYLYRNCGEGGTVRHQTPHGNLISNNRFATDSMGWGARGICLGSRQGLRPYCHSDNGYPFGSSLDNRDFADDNILTGNLFAPGSSRDIVDNGKNNRIEP